MILERVLGGQRSWVVGASSDIGRAVAGQLAAAGSDVVLFGRDVGALERTAQRCRSHDVAVATVAVDLTDVASEAKMDEARETARVDHVVWAAGAFDWARADVADADAWANLVHINLVAAMRTTRLVLPDLVAAGGGSLVYIASLAGLDVFANNAAYVASKHGLVAFARAVFLDVRDHGVKVCAVCPGLVDAGATTGFPSEQRGLFLRPSDIADAVLYVVTSSATACPTEIRLEPQLDPHRQSGP